MGRITRLTCKCRVVEVVFFVTNGHQVDLGLRTWLENKVVSAFSNINLMFDRRIDYCGHLKERLFVPPNNVAFRILLHLDHVNCLPGANKQLHCESSIRVDRQVDRIKKLLLYREVLNKRKVTL